MPPLLFLLQLLTVFNISSAQNINYFGVAFSPYVKNGNPNWDTYTLEEIKQMLRIILNRHNAVATYGMGVACNMFVTNNF